MPKPKIRVADVPDEELWQVYRVVGHFKNMVMGGIPADPEILEGHLARKGVPAVDAQMQQEMLEKTKELETAEGHMDSTTNIFLKDERGVYLRDYQLIGALKEAMAIKRYITSWRTKIQNGVRVMPECIYLYKNGKPVQTWDGFKQCVVHANYMGSPMASVKRVAYIEKPDFQADFWVGISGKEPIIDELTMAKLLKYMGPLGLGAMRHMNMGQLTYEFF